MITVVASEGATPDRWRLVSRSATSADVLAAGPRRSLRQLSDGAGELRIVATVDGHFRWTLTAPDGGMIAESPAEYRDADRCRQAFIQAQHAARTVLGR
ncbi:hypothetical protein GCM10010112_65500 [Actinoplanes lobatus]|uniref:Uncharacterized protein YegP (UPF0339 family) n=1 Tax=Actinoplanes lobatus TaxID=113568 RepID=A0A7W7HK46_9ACTN|nr:hypothetical protein [Actinoplanes lobatus]MBB4751974.1 uncharacterized protein YegP (UPF0339 family) [Actinoplanes lobatus]GGN85247.1 hypothetical protein GCM10010112_65500 [Actinoplanes lobatus]GIE44299.1 hypothetical protein Alo02nite_71970 [Actinoplanes lobatus]